jgi:Tfp pilus assembly protein PilF
MPAPKVESGLFQSRKVSTADVYALKADLSLFGPDGERTLKELVAFMQQNQQSAVVHRSLAWAFLQRHDLDNAVEHIRRSLELDDSDATMHYLYARWVNRLKFAWEQNCTRRCGATRTMRPHWSCSG